MANDLPSILRSIGFDEKEAALYLHGLEAGSAPASEYAKATGLNRITAYNMLEGMVRKGRFAVEKKIHGKWYAPATPETLAVEARQHVDRLDRVLPELTSLRGAAYRKPHVRFFEGWEGIRLVYDDSLTARTELLNFANSAAVRECWPGYDEEYVAERVRRGIRLRGIAPDDAEGRRVHGEDRKQLREIRLIPARDFDFTNEINIYDNKMAICSFGGSLKTCSFGKSSSGARMSGKNFPVQSQEERDLFAVIIESKEVAETQRQIFEMAWRYAGKRKL